MSKYFPKPTLFLEGEGGGGGAKLPTGVDTFKFAKQTDLASLKSEIDKSGIIKLETASVALSKLRN